jgi:hypothetical protein
MIKAQTKKKEKSKTSSHSIPNVFPKFSHFIPPIIFAIR